MLQSLICHFEHGEGAAAEEVVLFGIQTVVVFGIEEHDLTRQAGVRRSDVTGGRCLVLTEVPLVLVQVIGLGILRTPLPGVALVGGQQIIHSADGNQRNAIRHPDTAQALIPLGGILSVFLVNVDRNLRVILKADRIHTSKLLFLQVQNRDGVCLLQGNISGIVGAGDILGFQIHRGSSVLFQDNIGICQSIMIKLLKADVLGAVITHVDDGDGAFGVTDFLPIAHSRLALVGGQDLAAVRGEGHHVGLDAGLHGLDKGQGAVSVTGKKSHPAVVRIALGLNRGSQPGAVWGDGHGGHVPVRKGIVSHKFFHIDIHTGQTSGRIL